MTSVIKNVVRYFSRAANFVPTKLGYKIELRRGGNFNDVWGANKIFDNCSLKWNEKGFWSVDPMPSEQELDEYYENDYWDSRVKNEGVSKRDITHWIMLNDLVPSYFESKKTILNFGAGQGGGFSHLAWAAGHNIFNVESAEMATFYSDRWAVVNNISDVEIDNVDLVYGSHSLEHVQSIDKFETILLKKLNSDALIFWEVPNGCAKGMGPKEGKINIPHTYYFTVDYFEKRYSEVILNETFDPIIDGDIRNWESKKSRGGEGKIIRFLGRF